jgi:hypothetical protein
MDDPVNPPDPLDRNISKLVRGAKPVEPARPGVQQRIFSKVMSRVQSENATPKSSHFWSVFVAAAACIALGVLLFTQFFMKSVSVPFAHEQPKPPVIAPRHSENPDAMTTIATVPHVLQLETPDGTPAQQALSDGSRIEVAGNSRVEVLNYEDHSHRPEIRIRSGAVSCDIAQGKGRVLIHSAAGDVLAAGAKLKVAVTKDQPPANIKLATNVAPKVAMNVAIIQGEAIVREVTGEQLVAAGESVTVGGQSDTSSQVVENWRSGQLVPKLEDGRPGTPLQVHRHTVKATITEQIALVEVDEVFFNPGDQRMEGTFYFPLPHDATICRLAMYVGDNLMEGEIAEAQRARRTFEALVVQRVDPALLEWAGGNTFKMRVFPIEPKSEKRVLISYYEVLKKDHGRVTFTYPLASDATQQSAVGEININVSVDSTPSIESSSVAGYPSAVIKAAPNHLDVAYSAKGVTPKKDFMLQYQTAKGTPLVTVPYWHAKRNEGYFAMIFSPEMEQTSSEKHRASDFVFVVDKSGGLGARQLALAVKTIKGALSYLTPTDRFGIVAYDVTAQKFHPDLIAATPQNVGEAGMWLDGLEAFGASDLSQAWKAAAELTAGRTTQIVYTGSGLSTLTSTQSGKLLAEADAAFAGKDVRVHCLSLGTAQDLTFLDELSKKYSGTVRPVKDADDAAVATAELLEDFSWPIYKNVQVAFDGVSVDEIYPLTLPNVTAGRQLLIFGKYKNPAQGTVKLTAVRDGEPYSQVLNVNLGLDATRNFVPKLWATRRITQLQLDAASAAPEDAQNIVNDVIETSKRYRVMSQYTSFLVLETAEDYLKYGIERRPDEFDPNATQDIPQNLAGKYDADGLYYYDRMKFSSLSDKAENGKDEFRARDLDDGRRQPKGKEESRKLRAEGLQEQAELRRSSSSMDAPAEKLEKGSFSQRLGGGRKLMVMRHGGVKADDVDGMLSTETLKKITYKDAKQLEAGGLAWERQDIFPTIDRAELPAWNPRNAHSSDKALKLLKNLAARFESFAGTITQFSVDTAGKEHKERREWLFAFDIASKAFVSRALDEDHVDICDGKMRARLFPHLKYAARRKAVENDLQSIANTLPNYLLPWAEWIDAQLLVSVEHDGEDGVVLRLADRNDAHRYTLLYLASANGPVTKIEYFDRRVEMDKPVSVKTHTVFAEDVKEFGDMKVATAYRDVWHGDKDTVQKITRMSDIKVNFKPESELFKLEIPADWAVRDLDAQPENSDKHPLSQPVNPSPNFGPQRR